MRATFGSFAPNPVILGLWLQKDVIPGLVPGTNRGRGGNLGPRNKSGDDVVLSRSFHLLTPLRQALRRELAYPSTSITARTIASGASCGRKCPATGMTRRS